MASYVIGGLSRLTVRVSKLLAEEGDEVTVLSNPGEEELRSLLDSRVRVLPLQGDRETVMRAAGLDEAACLLALGEDDLQNLRTLVAGGAAAPHVPLVLRAFDPVLAEQVTRHGRLRRAFSVSALAAPAFIVAASGGEVAETMRLGSEEVPVARLPIAQGSTVAGLTVREVEQRTGCAVLAEALGDGRWRPVMDPARTLAEGESIAVGGPLMDVLGLAQLAAAPLPARRRDREAARERRRELRRRMPRPLVVSGVLLVGVLVTMVAVFGVVLHTGPVHAFYDAVLTAFGNGPVDATKPEHGGLKVFAVICMIATGILVAAVFSYATAAVTSERLERREARRIAKLRGHAVVAGLDNVGYRLEQVLHRMGVPTVAVDREPDARFSAALAARTPLVQGDPRLRENLERAGMDRAGVLFAVTEDELLNVQVCLQARALNPTVRTVARVFDEDFAGDASRTLGIDATLSASMAAATAFVSAATDEQPVRPFQMGGLELAARRLDVTRQMARTEIEAWAAQGIQPLAYRPPGGAAQRASTLPEVVEPGSHLILAGPEEAIRRTSA